jgi:subtilisin-like proprotein convertase family protein
MELQHAFALTSTIIDMQQERLRTLPRTQSRQATTRRRPRGRAPKLIVGLLVLVLLIAVVAPAFAGSPKRHHSSAAAHQPHAVAADKKKGGKGKTTTRTFQSGDANGAEISIPAVDSLGDLGPADPYPSTIAVTGFGAKARIADVNLTLRNLSHSFTRDIDVMLVSPDGRNAVVMGDIGGAEVLAEVRDLTITLDDEAATPLPTADDVALTSGTFQPLDNLGPIDDDQPALTAFPEPAPVQSGANALSTFDGGNPQGEWRLFIVDDQVGDVGQLAGGWSLEITAKSKVKVKDKRKPRHHRRH